jgi:undecaprenyl-diphosphatase
MGPAAPPRRPLSSTLTWAIIALLILFTLLATAALSGRPFAWENTALTAIHNALSPTLDTPAIWWSRIFHPQLLIVASTLLAIGYSLRRQWRWTILTLATVAGAQLINTIVKAIIQRPRPALWPTLTVETSTGFPSGHAMTSCAFAALLLLILWPTRWRTPALAIAALWITFTALARLTLGVHYPTDILAGWSLTLAWVATLWLLLGIERLR